MVSKIHQNAILRGTINSYCLACESFLRTGKEASQHIDKPIHQKNLEAAVYSEKFPGEGVRKVKMGYFCEHCNILLPIVNKATLHIAESAHRNNKGCNNLKAKDGDVIAFASILIKEKTWHGIMDDICLVCNTEFDYEGLHKSSSGHALNLVQKTIEFSKNNGVYRHIDESSFHCFTCDKVLPQASVSSHFDETEHKELYEKCRVEIKDDMTSNDDEIPAIPEPNDPKKTTASVDTAKDIKTKPAKDFSKAVVVVDTNNNKSEGSIDPVKFAADNRITYNANNTNAYCRVCDKRFPSSVNSMKEHVAGGPHIKKIAQMKAQPKYTKEPMKEYIKTAFNIGSLFQEETVVNEKFCMTFFSFQMITRNNAALRCQTCEVNISRHDDDVRSHAETSRHERSMSETPVVTSITDEFIREVRSGVFHCGFCNLVIGAWEVVNDHLQSSDHKEQKNSAKWRLQRHLPSIVEHKRELAQRQMFMEMMMMRRLFN